MLADIVEIVAFRARARDVADLAAVHGWSLPAMGCVQRTAAGIALCVRPERWLLLAPQRTTGSRQRGWHAALAGAGASLDASSALVIVHLAGFAWRAMLARGCRVDLERQAFGPGTAAATHIAQVQVILAALGEGVLLLTPATTAQHLHEWLLATARPFGVGVPEGATVELFDGDREA
jgi:sarcosine oxidase, subunit gamma